MQRRVPENANKIFPFCILPIPIFFLWARLKVFFLGHKALRFIIFSHVFFLSLFARPLEINFLNFFFIFVCF